MTLFILSFFAGVLTLLAPCILPLLPVIVGRSITDTTLSKRRAVTVTLSLGLSVVLFTLILKVSTLFVDIPQDFWKYLSGGIIFFFGLFTLFPEIWDSLSFNSKINTESNKILMVGYSKDSLIGDVVVGASLGPIFSACSPTYFLILATVLPAQPFLGFLYLCVYAFGLCMALLIVSILGKKVMIKLSLVSDSRGWFKRILGGIFILVSLGILTGYDKKLQTSLLDVGFFDVTKLEQRFLDSRGNKDAQKIEETSQNVKIEEFLTVDQKAKKFILAPEISSPDGYINTLGKPVTIGEFKGKKVVLLDIWTYSCINCQRTLPYLNEWYKKYEDDGLVVIGLHTPEFAFEHIIKNVEKATKNFSVNYPVVLDNDFSTWRAYENRYWPRKYLIDIDGYIVYDHAGEGQYEETEIEIQKALSELNNRLKIENEISKDISKPVGVIEVHSNKIKSSEVYFGSTRNEYLANGVKGLTGEQTFLIPSIKFFNKLYLGGIWDINPEYTESKSSGSIVFNYEAKNVYITALSREGIEIEIYQDNVFVKKLIIKDEKLYQLIQDNNYEKHELRIVVPKSGLQVFTFTFG